MVVRAREEQWLAIQSRFRAEPKSPTKAVTVLARSDGPASGEPKDDDSLITPDNWFSAMRSGKTPNGNIGPASLTR